MPATSPFTYDFDTNAPVAFIRLLIADTVNTDAQPAIFSDTEINAFYAIQQAQFQSSMYFSPPAGRNLPNSPVSYLRVAALALDSMAGNSSKLAGIAKLLDVQVSQDKTAEALRAQAAQFRQTDDESGAFAIIEQVKTTWDYTTRFWNQIQRMQGGV